MQKFNIAHVTSKSGGPADELNAGYSAFRLVDLSNAKSWLIRTGLACLFFGSVIDTAQAQAVAAGDAPPAAEAEAPGSGDGTTVASSSPPPLCKDLGTPIESARLPALTGARIKARPSGAAEFEELFSVFDSNRARSARLLPDDLRTAQFVELDGRRICLDLPDQEKRQCSVPIRCLSGEADFVLADDRGEPFAQLELAAAGEPPLARGHDWVRYAGGSFVLPLSASGPLSDDMLTVPNMRADGCAVGRGHPDLDQAFAFGWEGTKCPASGRASGAGTVLFLRKNGHPSSLTFGPGTGLALVDGKIEWSFPTAPITGRLECATTNGGIPTRAEDVASIKFYLTVPSTVNLGDIFVTEQIMSEALPLVEEICGVPGDQRDVDYRIDLTVPAGPPRYIETGFEARGNFYFSLNGDEDENIALRDFKRDNELTRRLRQRFVDFLTRDFRSKWNEEMRRQIEGEAQINNPANVLSHDEIGTLLGFMDGRSIPMQWDSTVVEDGVFISSNLFSSNVPLDFYFGDLDGDQWFQWQTAVQVTTPARQVLVECRIPAGAAEQLPHTGNFWVTAELVSFDGGRLVMECSE